MALLTKNNLTTLCSFLWCASSIAAVDTIQGSFGGMTNQINRDIGDVPGNRYNGDMRFTYHEDSPYKVERKFDFSALVNDQSLTMYSLQEAYVVKRGLFTSFDPVHKTGDQLRFGRQNLDWSGLDSAWGLGKINNRRNFDFFEPGQEGLVGVAYEFKAESGVFFKVFGSGLFVPELNPGLDIDKENGTIQSRNAWAKPPASSTQIDGKETPIRYNVDYPEISEVVNRASLGASAGLETEHWGTNAYFIRKPENQLSTKVAVKLASTADVIIADVKPEFYYHDVFGANLKYKNRDFELYVSGIAAFPNTFPDGRQDATEQTELKTEKRREAYLGGGASKVNDKYGVGVNYIARVTPYDRDTDSLAADPRWNQAVNAFLMRSFGRKFKVMGDLKYDMLTTDRLVMLRGGYSVSKQLLITLGVNMIGTPNDGKSFWSPYTNNDAVYAGLRYVY